MKFLKNAILLSASLLFTLFLAEITLRIIDFPKENWSPWIRDTQTGFKFAPNLTQSMITSEYQTLIETNELGLRDQAISKEKTKPRVLLLGDSFAFGYGVNESKIFARLIEDKINLDVVNAAIGGFDLIHYLQFLKYQSDTLKPDVILLVLYLGNDLVGNSKWKVEGDHLLPIDTRMNPATRKRREFKLVTLLRMARQTIFQWGNLKRDDWNMRSEYLEMTSLKLSENAKKNYAYSFELLSQIKEETTSRHIPLYVAVMPYKVLVETESFEKLKAANPDFLNQFDLNQPRVKILAWLAQANVPFIDLTDGLKAAYNQNNTPLYYQKDGHLNELGHMIVSELLADFLKKNFGNGN